ncbi:MAG: hypothetical protein HZA16_13060 [Nitrospirae bacterium]|nr:hypothetical protein [Nitrospirota bacterium]
MSKKPYIVRGIALALVFSFLVLFSLDAQAAYQTNLSAGVYITGIDVGEYSVPEVYDWNNDGMKDLIVGSRTGTSPSFHGYVNFFENTGTDSSPSFSGSSFLQACTQTCSAIDAAAGG